MLVHPLSDSFKHLVVLQDLVNVANWIVGVTRAVWGGKEGESKRKGREEREEEGWEGFGRRERVARIRIKIATKGHYLFALYYSLIDSSSFDHDEERLIFLV